MVTSTKKGTNLGKQRMVFHIKVILYWYGNQWIWQATTAMCGDAGSRYGGRHDVHYVDITPSAQATNYARMCQHHYLSLIISVITAVDKITHNHCIFPQYVPHNNVFPTSINV